MTATAMPVQECTYPNHNDRPHQHQSNPDGQVFPSGIGWVSTYRPHYWTLIPGAFGKGEHVTPTEPTVTFCEYRSHPHAVHRHFHYPDGSVTYATRETYVLDQRSVDRGVVEQEGRFSRDRSLVTYVTPTEPEEDEHYE